MREIFSPFPRGGTLVGTWLVSVRRRTNPVYPVPNPRLGLRSHSVSPQTSHHLSLSLSLHPTYCLPAGIFKVFLKRCSFHEASADSLTLWLGLLISQQAQHLMQQNLMVSPHTQQILIIIIKFILLKIIKTIHLSLKTVHFRFPFL